MTHNKKIIIYCSIICLINFFIYSILYLNFYETSNMSFLILNKVIPYEYIENITLGIFTSTFVSLLISYLDYKNNKKIWITKYINLLYKCQTLFDDIEILNETVFNYNCECLNALNTIENNSKINKKMIEQFVKSINKETLNDIINKGININDIRELKEYFNEENLKITHKCVEYYKNQYDIIFDKNIVGELNICKDNIDFFIYQNNKIINDIWYYVSSTITDLVIVIRNHFKINNIDEITRGILIIQNILYNNDIYDNLYQKEINKYLNKLQDLNSKKIFKLTKN